MGHKKPEISLNDLKRQNADYALDIARRDEKIRALKLAIQGLEAELYNERTSRVALKRLYQGFDRKIIESIHRRGKKQKNISKTHPVVQSARSEDYGALIHAARIYDAEEFFTKQPPVPDRDLKLPYHILAESYTRTRNKGLKIAKKIYKMRSSR